MSSVTDLFDGALQAARTFFPQSTLAMFGVLLIILVPAGLLWSRLDRRQVQGESVATKPTKFLLSIGVHALTLSWAFGYVQTDRRDSLLPTVTVWAVIVSCVWELLCIASQAARGRMSHFNHATRYDSVVFTSMGIFAMLLLAANLPLAWEITVRPAGGVHSAMTVALVLGLLVSCFVGGATGVLMGVRNSHSVGSDAVRLPLLGWSATSGDVRVSHFFAIHALQALPLTAALASLLPPALATLLFVPAVTLYGLLIAATLVQALREQPIISVDLLQRVRG